MTMKYFLGNELGHALGKARQGKAGRVEFATTQILSVVFSRDPFLVVAETQ